GRLRIDVIEVLEIRRILHVVAEKRQPVAPLSLLRGGGQAQWQTEPAEGRRKGGNKAAADDGSSIGAQGCLRDMETGSGDRPSAIMSYFRQIATGTRGRTLNRLHVRESSREAPRVGYKVSGRMLRPAASSFLPPGLRPPWSRAPDYPPGC